MTAKATTKQWISFFFPRQCFERLTFEKTLSQIQHLPEARPRRPARAHRRA